MTAIDDIKAFFFPYKKIPIAPLVVFRMVFGGLMLFGTIRFLLKGWVQQLYIDPTHYFGYLGFEWVTPLNGQWMYLPFFLMIVASVLIILGCFYRVASLTFFLCFTYVELLDKSNYLNHYYFVSLVSFLMVLLPANRDFSVDTLIWPKIRQETTDRWHIGILKFQLALVYIFAGIAKINSDWLFDAQPLHTWLQAHHHLPVLGPYLEEKWVAYAFSWFGCLYDLFIIFFLLNRNLRKIGYFLVVIFHLTTWWLFPIGVFPWVMIFSTLIFFSSDFHLRIVNALKTVIPYKPKPTTPTLNSAQWVPYFLLIYVFIQLMVPFRYLVYPGNLFWNEEGFRFSWRVMLMHKEGHATFYVRDGQTSRESEINNAKFLTRTQEDQMATQPDMILQYAKLLKEHYEGKKLHYGDRSFTLKNPSIHAEIYVSLNGRPSQLFVSKEHDLSSLPYNLHHRKWVEPFTP